jgi:hypothetical protein
LREDGELFASSKSFNLPIIEQDVILLKFLDDNYLV